MLHHIHVIVVELGSDITYSIKCRQRILHLFTAAAHL